MERFLQQLHNSIKEQHFKRININSGGCGRAAIEFYKYFQSIPNIRVLGFKVLTDDTPKNRSIPVIHRHAQLPYYYSHIVLAIQVKGLTYYVDAVHGVVKADQYRSVSGYKHWKFLSGYVAPKVLKKHLSDSSIWNKSFDAKDIVKVRSFIRSLDVK